MREIKFVPDAIKKKRKVQGLIVEATGGQEAYERSLKRPFHTKGKNDHIDKYGYWRNRVTGQFCKIPTYG